jgi:arylsulfatase A-like enzyme
MYDHDLKVAMMIRGEGLPAGKTVRGMVGSVSLVPTLLDLVGIPTQEYDFDGSSLLPAIEKGEIKGGEVYSEDLFEARGEGALQSIRTDDVKLIRNLTLGTEEFYDLRNDPQEKNNLVGTIDQEKKIALRKKLNLRLISGVSGGAKFSKTEKEQIDQRLRRLGYIK